MCGSLRLPYASADFLLGVLFGPEDGDDIFFRNVKLSPNYTALQPMRPVRLKNPTKTQLLLFL
jgi:hypothetical protein